ncbi:uncharacterized protein L969DRAFT_92104 [Mixia osmundae IAM 14324]|uniref:Uncharacterized protein n=1 Tax=Mixia osmundae (strain CBS 9802 / IAM 14324 / JCM 22182 / KY 12970) TaxID=764103 RepID=G7E561_MIXOS|nr:uncharacterized protein L969DRAFT_92104 [Mixia osmundae IAM 14324]KEI42672.1 hypothetical protein L969DRAFT_92104 [Mixia osmundae IAM 14324]GAA97971.1 hypothetical protein E5Q_04651 [Mixia osmundae IAM 14324]
MAVEGRPDGPELERTDMKALIAARRKELAHQSASLEAADSLSSTADASGTALSHRTQSTAGSNLMLADAPPNMQLPESETSRQDSDSPQLQQPQDGSAAHGVDQPGKLTAEEQAQKRAADRDRMKAMIASRRQAMAALKPEPAEPVTDAVVDLHAQDDSDAQPNPRSDETVTAPDAPRVATSELPAAVEATAEASEEPPSASILLAASAAAASLSDSQAASLSTSRSSDAPQVEHAHGSEDADSLLTETYDLLATPDEEDNISLTRQQLQTDLEKLGIRLPSYRPPSAAQANLAYPEDEDILHAPLPDWDLSNAAAQSIGPLGLQQRRSSQPDEKTVLYAVKHDDPEEIAFDMRIKASLHSPQQTAKFPSPRKISGTEGAPLTHVSVLEGVYRPGLLFTDRTSQRATSAARSSDQGRLSSSSGPSDLRKASSNSSLSSTSSAPRHTVSRTPASSSRPGSSTARYPAGLAKVHTLAQTAPSTPRRVSQDATQVTPLARASMQPQRSDSTPNRFGIASTPSRRTSMLASSTHRSATPDAPIGRSCETHSAPISRIPTPRRSMLPTPKRRGYQPTGYA